MMAKLCTSDKGDQLCCRGGKKSSISIAGVVNTRGISFMLTLSSQTPPMWIPAGDCCLSLCLSESWSCRGRALPQTSPRRSRRQSLLWVLACWNTVLCVWGIIDHCFWVQLSSLWTHDWISPEKLPTILSWFCSLSNPPLPSCLAYFFFSLGSSAGSADAGVCEENHRSRRIQDGWEYTHTHAHTIKSLHSVEKLIFL